MLCTVYYLTSDIIMKKNVIFENLIHVDIIERILI